MRTLSSTLLAAQQALTLRPAVSCTLRPMSAAADRRTYTQVATLTTLPASRVVRCLSSGGLLYVYSLDTTNGHLAYRTVTQAGVESASTAIATISGNPTVMDVCLTPTGIAFLFYGGSLVVPTVTTCTSMTGTGHTNTIVGQWNGGLTSAAPWAIACSPSGKLALFGWGVLGGTVNARVVLAQTAPGTWPSSYAFAGNSVAASPSALFATYANDWLMLVCGTSLFDGAGLSEISACVYGDGSLASAGTFVAPFPALATLPNNGLGGTTLTMGSVCQCAQYVLPLFESFSGVYPTGVGTTGGYTLSRGYVTGATAALDMELGNMREPQALPSAVAGAALSACDATGVHWLVDGTHVWLAPAVSTVDYSARVLRAQRVESESGGSVTVLLDDSDGAVTSLGQDPATIGQQLALSFGYVTSTGSAEYSSGPPCWVSSATCLWDGETRVVELVGHDALALLASWRPRRAYAWLPGQATLSQIAAYLCGRAGVAYTVPGAPSTLLGEQPAFIVRPGGDGLRAFFDLLARAPECARLTPAGGVSLVQPWLSLTHAYDYGVGGAHPVVSARATLHGQGANHVQVMGVGNSTRLPQLLAEVSDDADQFREGQMIEMVRDMQLGGQYGPARATNAALRAASVLQKIQLVADAGEIVTAPNVGLEVWDVIGVTAAALGWSASTFVVREIRTIYAANHAEGVYTQSVGLAPGATGVRV